MIMIKGAVGKKKYKEPFSKGIMARSLYITDLGYDKSYEIATCIENKLLEENISEISIEDLAIFVTNYLKIMLILFLQRNILNGEMLENQKNHLLF